MFVGDGIGDTPGEKPLYDLLAWDNQTQTIQEKDASFDVYPNRWKVAAIDMTLLAFCTRRTYLRLEGRSHDPRAGFIARVDTNTP